LLTLGFTCNPASVHPLVSAIIDGTTLHNGEYSTFPIASYLTVEVPAKVAGDKYYYFDYWLPNDEKTSSIKILLSGDLSLQAVYQEGLPPRPCFIATAAYGSPLAPELDVIRAFRDQYLPDPVVDTYYFLSPPAANWLSRHEKMRAVVRSLLYPLVKIME
jgi:hypothetical protein